MLSQLYLYRDENRIRHSTNANENSIGSLITPPETPTLSIQAWENQGVDAGFDKDAIGNQIAMICMLNALDPLVAGVGFPSLVMTDQQIKDAFTTEEAQQMLEEAVTLRRECRANRLDKIQAYLKKNITNLEAQFAMVARLQQADVLQYMMSYEKFGVLGKIVGIPIEGILDFIVGNPDSAFVSDHLGLFVQNPIAITHCSEILLYSRIITAFEE